MPIEKYLKPPQGVREALRRGLELHEAGASGDGLQPETVSWARRMASGEPASRDKIIKMRAWHARHAVDKRPGWDSPPTPGYVAFLLWGGEPGRVWSNKVSDMIDREEAGKAMKTIDRKSVRISDGDLADEAGVFTGYASIFGNVDQHGDVVVPGAFRKSLSERGNVVPLLWQHDTTEPVGVIELVEDSKGLRVVRGEINLETAQGREAYALLKQGAIKGLSIGYQVVQDGWQGKVRQLKELKLMEVSLVTFPANELAGVTAIKDGSEHQSRMAQILTLIDVGMKDLAMAKAMMEALVMEGPEESTPPEGAAPEEPGMPEDGMPEMDTLAALLRAALKG
jgi:HK97 family phage prohead protease